MKNFLILLFYFISIGICNAQPLADKKTYIQEESKIEKFTIVVIPDTQKYTVSEENMFYFEKQIEWIKNNYLNENIVFISHVGDIVEYPYKGKISRLVKKLNLDFICASEIWKLTSKSNKVRWNRAYSQIQKLNNITHKVPISSVPGNHDYSCLDKKSSNSSFLNYLVLRNLFRKSGF